MRKLNCSILSIALVLGAGWPAVAGPSAPPPDPVPIPITTIPSCEWQPTCGTMVPLSAASPTHLTSVLGGGIMEIRVRYPQGMAGNPMIAYSVNYGGGAWYEEGTTKYFTLDSSLMMSQVRSGFQHVTVRLPLRIAGYPDLNPNTETVQTVQIWAGRSTSMTVNPTSGVSGHNATKSYGITSEYPAATVVPDYRGVVFGVDRGGSLTCRVAIKDTVETNTVFDISFTATPGLDEAITVPATVTIGPEQHYEDFNIVFDPTQSRHWPGIDSRLTLTLTGGDMSISTGMSFNAQQSSDLPGVGEPGEIEDWDKCSRHTSILAPSAYKKCGECAAPGPGAAPCTAGSSQIAYSPYACSFAWDECIISTKTFMGEIGTTVINTEDCWFWYVPSPGEIGTVWPVYYVKGKRQCCTLSPTGTFGSVDLPDCD